MELTGWCRALRAWVRIMKAQAELGSVALVARLAREGRDGLATVFASLRRARTKPPADSSLCRFHPHPPPSLQPSTSPHRPRSLSLPTLVETCRRCSRRLLAGPQPLVSRAGFTSQVHARSGTAPRTHGSSSQHAVQPLLPCAVLRPSCSGSSRSPETPDSPAVRLDRSLTWRPSSAVHHHLHLAPSSAVPSFGSSLSVLCIWLPVSSVVSSVCFPFGLLIRCDFLPEHCTSVFSTHARHHPSHHRRSIHLGLAAHARVGRFKHHDAHTVSCVPRQLVRRLTTAFHSRIV
ncbi:hypothetical protein EK21DRAFT_92796 [Setomelanomma holmii]|uniref:Uncharacterized protein n=1 Tax=Setomelanomma holmii TaxID=210430 RepID=A0A9P4H187_9PLEO|nr:hypothetical protein EK21DRAFT_92796 [Setomelanomma holmii]